MRITSLHTGDSPFAHMILRNTDDDTGGTPNENTENTPETSNSGQDTPKTPDLEKIINEAVEKAVAGLKKKNEEVIGDNKRLKTELTSVKSKPSLTEEEYAEFKSVKERMERDEFARLMMEGKSEEVIARVTQRTRLDLEAKVAAEAEARTAKEAEAHDWKTKYESTLISVEVAKSTAAAVKPAYQDLVMKLAAERTKLVDGAVRIVNAEGEIEMNAAGTKPLSVSDYVESLRSTYAELFIPSSGGGAGGSGKKATGGTSNQIAMDLAGKMTPEEFIAARTAGKIA